MAPAAYTEDFYGGIDIYIYEGVGREVPGLERRAADLLELYGLSEREALVLLHIVKRGSSSAGEIAKALQLRRVEAYKLVKKLAEDNLIHASAGKPVTYSSQPLESFITTITGAQMQKLKGMEMAKEELITLSRNLPRSHSKASNQQFRMIQGREQIYGHLGRMVRGASKSVDLILTRSDLALSHVVGLTDSLNQAADRGTKVRLISRVDESTMEAAEGLSNRCELRHSNVTTLGRLSVADTSQTLISLVLDKSLGKRNAKDVAIWSDSGDFAGMMGSLFDTAYRASVPRQGKLRVVGAPEETAE